MIVLDLAQQRFGRLLVLQLHARINQRKVWRCACDCGKETLVPSRDLRSGNTKSCGCLGVEARAIATKVSNTTHGMSRTPTYEVWFNMLRRCEDPAHKSYPDYGGRGIRVCTGWRTFEGFHADMGTRPARMTLDRIKVEGDYERSNCRWATYTEQQNNKRNNRVLRAFGRSQTAAEWAREYGITADALGKRLGAGWPVEKAICQRMKADLRRAGMALGAAR